MNPEFVRNTWLELSPLRLWGLPLVVIALAIVFNSFGPAGASGLNWEGFRSLGMTIFAIFAVWGGNKAAQSVTNEVIAVTWDWQRLAEHRPLELLVGKLFGSTVFEWLGMACGLALFALGSVVKAPPGAIALDVLTLTLGALWLHSLALFASLTAAASLRATRRATSHRARQSGTLIVLLLLSLWIGPAIFQALSGGESAANPVAWWWTMPASNFVPLSLAMFICWTLVGAHRLIRSELQEPVSPLPWLGFLLFLTLYGYPVLPAERIAGLLPTPALFFGLSAVVCGALFYPLLLGERKDVVRVRSLAAAWSRGDAAGVWTRLPLWGFNLVGYALSLAALAVSGALWPSDEHWILVGVAASFGLFMVRDLGWILAVHLAPAPGRRPDLVVWFFLAVLYGLIPLVIATLGEQAVMGLYLFVPGWPVAEGAKEAAVTVLPPLLWALPGLVVAWAVAWPRLRRALER